MLRSIFFNRYASSTITLIVIHQAIIASSAYFLIKAITAHNESQPFEIYVVMYLLSMILPFVPGCLSFVSSQAWANDAHKRIVLALIQHKKDKAWLFREAKLKDDFGIAVSRNSFGVISNYISLTHDFLSLALNSLLSFAVIGYLLPKELFWGYVISLIASAVVITIFSRVVRRPSVDTEEKYISYGNVLSSGWDNYSVGNVYNRRMWDGRFEEKSNEYYRSQLKLSFYMQTGNLLTALVALVPTAYLIAGLIYSDRYDAAVVAAVVVSLTRVFQILGSLSTMMYQMVAWSSARAKLDFLSGFMNTGSDSASIGSNVGKIFVNGEALDSFEDMLTRVQNSSSGRLTVRGENGVGKSTLLLYLKSALNDKAFLLPAGNAQLCWNGDYSKKSTGERSLGWLKELYENNVKPNVILLDEWDANLDVKNKSWISEELDLISANSLVVEVRH